MNKKNLFRVFDELIGPTRDMLVYNDIENTIVGDSQRDHTIYEDDDCEIIYTTQRDTHIVSEYNKKDGNVRHLVTIKIHWEVE